MSGFQEFHDENLGKEIPINGQNENIGNKNNEFTINVNANITEEVSNVTVNYINNYLSFISKYFIKSYIY